MELVSRIYGTEIINQENTSNAMEETCTHAPRRCCVQNLLRPEGAFKSSFLPHYFKAMSRLLAVGRIPFLLVF